MREPSSVRPSLVDRSDAAAFTSPIRKTQPGSGYLGRARVRGKLDENVESGGSRNGNAGGRRTAPSVVRDARRPR